MWFRQVGAMAILALALFSETSFAAKPSGGKDANKAVNADSSKISGTKAPASKAELEIARMFEKYGCHPKNCDKNTCKPQKPPKPPSSDPSFRGKPPPDPIDSRDNYVEGDPVPIKLARLKSKKDDKDKKKNYKRLPPGRNTEPPPGSVSSLLAVLCVSSY